MAKEQIDGEGFIQMTPYPPDSIGDLWRGLRRVEEGPLTKAKVEALYNLANLTRESSLIMDDPSFDPDRSS